MAHFNFGLLAVNATVEASGIAVLFFTGILTNRTFAAARAGLTAWLCGSGCVAFVSNMRGVSIAARDSDWGCREAAAGSILPGAIVGTDENLPALQEYADAMRRLGFDREAFTSPESAGEWIADRLNLLMEQERWRASRVRSSAQ